MHSWKIWEPVVPALLHNGHKWTFKWSYRWNIELKIETYIKQISCNVKSICFYPLTRRYNTSRGVGGMVIPNFLLGRRDSSHLGDGKCMYHFTPLAQCTVGDLVLIIDYLWCSLNQVYCTLTLQANNSYMQLVTPPSQLAHWVSAQYPSLLLSHDRISN